MIGKLDGTSHTNGIPSIRRNVYGGGEGGSIYGTAHLIINNGYIGYNYKNTGTEQAPNYEYVEELDDEEAGDKKLEKHGGNAFGGGYVANSFVDHTDIKMYGGTIRGSLFGGGEIGPVGRGTVKTSAPDAKSGPTFTNGVAKIYMPGSTRVQLYQGTVKRNVFGGGRGYDNWRGEGYMTKPEQATMDLSSKGYVFGNTEVYIHGGKIGTKERVVSGDGNVFGGGDEGFVYSAHGTKATTTSGTKTAGYYYDGDNLTEDCKVIISPYCPVNERIIKVLTDITTGTGEGATTYYKANDYITQAQFDAIPDETKNTLVQETNWKYDASYTPGSYIETEDLNKLSNGSGQRWIRRVLKLPMRCLPVVTPQQVLMPSMSILQLYSEMLQRL